MVENNRRKKGVHLRIYRRHSERERERERQGGGESDRLVFVSCDQKKNNEGYPSHTSTHDKTIKKRGSRVNSKVSSGVSSGGSSG